MNPSEHHIKHLWQQLLDSGASNKELDELIQYLQQNPEEQLSVDHLVKQMEEFDGQESLSTEVWEERLASILKKQEPAPVYRINHWTKYWTRYVAILALAVGAVFYLTTRRISTVSVSAEAKMPVIAPGGNKAVLTLSNGATIELGNGATGKIASQGSANVIQQANGQLAYKSEGASVGQELRNTVTTPKGGQYVLLLQDGTRVWLNAASSISFPVIFTGAVREVEVTGEAYFEVAPDSRKTFAVKAGAETVHVLGTSFNINAYTDESAIVTSLVSGKVKVAVSASTGLLSPGQQSLLTSDGKISIRPATLDKVLAWKNGVFALDHADIYSMMRQIGRWYDVDIRFQGKFDQKDVFGGDIPRNLSLNKVLELIEATQGVHFTYNNKQLTVTP